MKTTWFFHKHTVRLNPLHFGINIFKSDSGIEIVPCIYLPIFKKKDFEYWDACLMAKDCWHYLYFTTYFRIRSKAIVECSELTGLTALKYKFILDYKPKFSWRVINFNIFMSESTRGVEGKK